jgi:hypothetical protein
MSKFSCCSLALFAALTVASNFPARAQGGPQDYRYCALDRSGGTVCYFNNREACAASANGRCIDNPWYTGTNAFAQQPLGAQRRRNR